MTTERLIHRRVVATAIAIALTTGISRTRAEPVNSSTVVSQGIEHLLQTDKTVYDVGEEVDILFRVTNLTDQPVTFRFTSGPPRRQTRFTIQKEGKLIWDTASLATTRALTAFTLDSLEMNDFTELGDYPGHGKPTKPGHYEITALLYEPYQPDWYDPVSVSVEMDIIPEPATLLLLGMGSLVMLRRRRR